MISDTEYKRIYWHSRRGMLELDLILMPFVEQHLRRLPEDDQQRYVALLEQEDTDMFRWFLRLSGGRRHPACEVSVWPLVWRQ